MTYQIAAILMTLHDLEGHSAIAIFRTFLKQLTRFQLS